MIHRPVLLNEVLNLLDIKPDGVYLDATVGSGGHAIEIAKRLQDGILIGIDWDQQILEYAREKLKPFSAKIHLVYANFKGLERVLDEFGLKEVDGILFDLGLSSLQLDSPERGFSFRFDSELDMRMDQGQNTLTAAEIVNNYGDDQLVRILKEYGEERWARKIVAGIMKEREKAEIKTTGQLVGIIEKTIPIPAQRMRFDLKMKIHPATKTFQALRIAVNDELNNLRQGLEASFRRLKQGGVMAVISFHSLEDRIVKRFFQEKAKGCICPPDLPVCRCGKQVELEPFKLITPHAEEIKENPRARSAKLRGAKKVI